MARKVNAAHPPSAEVRLAHERLQSWLTQDSRALEAGNTKFDTLMTLRALVCSKNVSIGRLASVADVKALALDPRCFQEQDKDLLQYLGLRAIGVRLGQPALRPLKPLGPAAQLPGPEMGQVVSASVAAEANVAVLRASRGELTVVELPGGRPIASLGQAGAMAAINGSLAPNGRVYALSNGLQGTTFYDTETGDRLWDGVGASALIAWLPEVDAFVYNTVREGVLMLADTRAGTVEAHPLGARNRSWGTRVGPGRTLIGTGNEADLVEHTRTPEGLRATGLKQYRLTGGQGVTSSAPMTLRDGRLVVFNSMRDLGWLDLESGASGVWKLSPYFRVPFARLDQTHVLIDSVERNGMTLKQWSFDVVAETVAQVDFGTASTGITLDIGNRTGFVRRGSQVWIGDLVTPGEAVAMAKLVAEHDLQLQLAKLQAQAQVDAAAAGAPGAAGVLAPPLTPGLGGVPQDAVVHMVGVYQGERHAGTSADGRPLREVRINVRPSSRPVVLALAAYEPVRWTVINSGARVAAILLSGYHPSTVLGAGNATVIRIGSAYAYTTAGAEYARLRQAVTQYTGSREIRSFQGGYTGAEFSIGP